MILFQAKKTPLHLAAQNGMIEVCSTLLTIKADANATDVVSNLFHFCLTSPKRMPELANRRSYITVVPN